MRLSFSLGIFSKAKCFHLKFFTAILVGLGLSSCNLPATKSISPFQEGDFASIRQILTAPLAARSGKSVITPEWLLNLPQNEQYPLLKWLDNTHLLYSSPPLNNTQNPTIGVIDVRTGTQTILAEGSDPNPSPDGKWIAFIQGKKEKKQLWIMDSKGANARQFTHIQGGLGEWYGYDFDFSWSPNSQKIALNRQPYVPHWEKKPRLESKIYIIDIKTTHMQQVASFDASIRRLSWFPSGEELLFMKERVGFDYNEEKDYEWIVALNLKDGKSRTLAAFDGLQQSLNPTLSPDGKKVAILYDADHPMFDFMRSIGIINNESSSHDITRLAHEMNLYPLQWSHDSQRIYARRYYGAYHQLYAIDVHTGTLTQITNAPLNIEGYALSPDGLQLAWIGQDAQATRVIRVASSEGHNVRDLLTIPGVPKDMALSEVREIDWQAPPDYPGRMRGLLFMPLNYKEGTRYPLIVDIHGGGAGASLNLTGGILVNSPFEWHMWAAKGYAVFVPEFRSSASFGSLAITRDVLQNNDIVNCDIKDIEAGVVSLIDQGIADPQRLAVIGHSAGGRRANWLVATTHQFKAVVSKEGWADEWIGSLSNKPSKRVYQMRGGAPWEVPQNYLKNSALFHCNGATTPTLFLMGNPDLGGADPYKTVFMLHNALNGQGVETEYVQYPDEGHMYIFKKEKNKRNCLERAIQWIDKHIGSKGS